MLDAVHSYTYTHLQNQGLRYRLTCTGLLAFAMLPLPGWLGGAAVCFEGEPPVDSRRAALIFSDVDGTEEAGGKTESVRDGVSGEGEAENIPESSRTRIFF